VLPRALAEGPLLFPNPYGRIAPLPTFLIQSPAARGAQKP
jgi:hypothetical protein